MKSEDWRLVILGLIAAIQAIAVVVIPILIQRSARRNDAAMAAQNETLAAQSTTLETVHTIVNSRYDALVEQIKEKDAEIARLKAAAAQA